jgi:hypothetical protein
LDSLVSKVLSDSREREESLGQLVTQEMVENQERKDTPVKKEPEENKVHLEHQEQPVPMDHLDQLVPWDDEDLMDHKDQSETTVPMVCKEVKVPEEPKV